MKRLLSILLTLVLLCTSAFAAGFSADAPAINEKVNSVMLLAVYSNDDILIASGSGFVAFDSGLFVTNCHVIEKVATIVAYADSGETYAVNRILCADSDRDIAILCFEEPVPMEPLTLNESGEVLRASPAVAVGSPKGFTNMVSIGNISATFEEEGVKYIQFTAPVSSGSSGGALFDDEGNVIGITTAAYDDGEGIAQNLNFAVNITEVIDLYNAHKDDEPADLDSWTRVNVGTSTELNKENEHGGTNVTSLEFTINNEAGRGITEVYLYPMNSDKCGKARNSGWIYKDTTGTIAVTAEEASQKTRWQLRIGLNFNGAVLYVTFLDVDLSILLGNEFHIWVNAKGEYEMEIR